MDGGKLKGFGAYGCIFQPPLECKYSKDTKTNPKYITKLSTNESAEREWKISNYMKNNLSNYDNYAITWKSRCTPAKKQKDRDINKCMLARGISRNPNNFTILQARHGGITLDQQIKNLLKVFRGNSNNKGKEWKLKYSLLIRGTEPLFQGISDFYENEIVHNDIKDQNIVKLKKDASTLEKGSRFIDFGLSVLISKEMYLLKEKSLVSFEEPRWYFVYPPEYLFCMAPPIELKDEFINVKKRIFYNEIRSLHVNYIETCTTNKEFDSKIKKVIRKAINGDFDSDSALYDMYMKTDVYSLGMSFLFLLEYLGRGGSKKIMKDQFKRSKPGTFLGDLKILLQKMMDLDYNKRIDATKAHKEFKYILSQNYRNESSEKKTKKVKTVKNKTKKNRSKTKYKKKRP